jgi:hypothetical protein
MAYSLWESQTDHKHDDKSTTRLPSESVEIVKQCFKNNIKSTKMIINQLKQQQLPQLTSKQIANLKARIKENELGKTKVELYDLVDWCNERLQIPEDEDEVFCGDIHYKINNDDELEELRIFVTTKRLVSFRHFSIE